MQYYKPDGDFFVGDCMPFYHAGTFRLFYLLDQGHHSALGGLGGHQWAQATSTDLVHWIHHPLAIPITEEREGSICTGSVLYHQGTYYAFYATRMRDWTQHLSLATSDDGIHFKKAQPNPFASPPPGYHPHHYRDPAVFRDGEGLFHLLVTAYLEGWRVPDRGGCLAHLVSADLKRWEHRDPFIVPGLPGAPECPDYFTWNGWTYLLFSNGGVARYRMSRDPFGPWLRPTVDTLDGPAARVTKTAPFGPDRRLGVAWLGTRADDKDAGSFQFGGNALFRELVQHGDGTLGARFPAEMTRAGKPVFLLRLSPTSPGAHVEGRRVHIASPQGLAVASCSGVPHSARLSVRILPRPGAAAFGLRLLSRGTFEGGYGLHFAPHEATISLHDQRITSVDGVAQPFDLEIVLQGDIIDVCIDRRRTLVDRCPERRGDQLLFYAQDAEVEFDLREVVALPAR